ncbi:glycosyltransferase family 4 protein [Methanooceanicella nereidis]|nr:glycosyltransferase family 4 protein [Methanocella sp. CWC-04]
MMNIAVVTPQSVKGERGGAEGLYDGLIKALITKGHNVNHVKVLVDESTFESIVQAYCYCYYLDLDDYDVVISTKAPTYMVRHRNHISYLLHTIRVFYDMFDEISLGLDKIKQRELIYAFDKYGLDPSRIKKHCTIGHTVEERLRNADQFWNNIDFKLIYPDTLLSGFSEPKKGEFIFLPGRLHRWKRIDLVIKSMKYVKNGVKLLLAGKGEDEKNLKKLTRDLGLENRIEFLGPVSDNELIDLYSRSIVIPFVTKKEDFGYITIEAFRAKKPVITCHDSGEPTYIVKDGVSGFIVEPDPIKIAEKINFFIENPDEAANMGINGYDAVRHITWDNVTNDMLDGINIDPSERTPKINTLVLDMQPIEPAIGGGRLRLKGLYSNFPRNFQVTYIGSYDWSGEQHREIKISDNLNEIDVPFSKTHFDINSYLNKLVPQNVTIDVLSPFLIFASDEYVNRVKKELIKNEVIIVSHPWIYSVIYDDIKDKLLIYDSHNYEYGLREQLFPKNGFGKCIVEYVRFVESNLCKQADIILACSDEDKAKFVLNYGVDPEKIFILPNGTFVKDYDINIEKNKLKNELGIDNFAAIFVGSNYAPNVDAAEFIIKTLAQECGDIQFIIVGGVSDCVDKTSIPSNVLITGLVSNDDLKKYMLASDIALNPMVRGSGINIKMLDYFAAGLPVITTKIGARGLYNKNNYIESELSDFRKYIKLFLDDKNILTEMSKCARNTAESEYDWNKLSINLGNLIGKSLRGK